ncbi:hypothetical protein [Agromyces badenianii]|uniref:hypothetical protein n=1 Tax=Agromyces badenianii TaxID=2080742 RepID=UPI001F18A469|nr:hypothetical protein [Agromyces badenianii]
MTTHADDQPLPGLGASADELASRAGRRSADDGGTLRPRRIPAPEWGRHPSPRDVQRYYLCSEEPSGEFVEVIIPVTDDGRRRYFTTSDGERLTEVDEDYFVRRREGNARSLLELDSREMAELQAELNFVRPVLGRDPLAEAAAAEPEPEMTTAAALEPPDGTEAEDEEAEAEDEEDDDDETTEEYHAVMGSSRFEQVEPEASVMPTNVTPMPVALSAVAHASTHPAAHTHVPAHAAPPARAAALAPDSTRAADAAAQVSLAKGIAFVAHRGQVDRVGAEYIDHPGRVAERFDPLTDSVSAAAGWLHDVLEDTSVTVQELLEAGVLPEIVEVVQLLTRTPDVADNEYFARIRRHPVARGVKIADIDDNSAPWRVRRLGYEEQVRLAEKYRHAREALDGE